MTDELYTQPMHRIIKKTGKNVSRKASALLRDEIEKKTVEVAERAEELAEHAGRKTVTEEDIQAAVNQIL